MKVRITPILKRKLTRIVIGLEMSIKLIKKYSFTVYLINRRALPLLILLVVFVLNFCNFSNLSAQFQGKKNLGLRSE